VGGRTTVRSLGAFYILVRYPFCSHWENEETSRNPEIEGPRNEIGSLLGGLALGAIVAAGALTIIKILTETGED
jgi:hypothetical protein